MTILVKITHCDEKNDKNLRVRELTADKSYLIKTTTLKNGESYELHIWSDKIVEIEEDPQTFAPFNHTSGSVSDG